MTLHRGKIARQPIIGTVRPLTRDDLMLIKEQNGPSVTRHGDGVVQRFRDPHFRVARLFALGLKIGEVAERTGYSYNRCHTLERDPAFQEIVAKLRARIDDRVVEAADEFAEMATANMRKAETQLAEKLEAADEAGEFLPTRDLIAIVADRADRFGYGKRQTNVNINADFAAEMEATRARSKMKTIEARSSQEFPPVAPDPMPIASQSLGEPNVPAVQAPSTSTQSPVASPLRRLA